MKLKLRHLQVFVRNVLNIAWIVLIWRNSHWSVALVCTHVILNEELRTLKRQRAEDVMKGRGK